MKPITPEQLRHFLDACSTSTATSHNVGAVTVTTSYDLSSAPVSTPHRGAIITRLRTALAADDWDRLSASEQITTTPDGHKHVVTMISSKSGRSVEVQQPIVEAFDHVMDRHVRAALLVCSKAKSVDDARTLMEALGLIDALKAA